MPVSTEFVGERIDPLPGAFDTTAMSRGEPGLPQRFVWRGEEHEIAAVLESWKQTGPCTHGSKERYVKKHWWRVRTKAGLEMKLSFDRAARTPTQMRAAWWLNSVSPGTGATGSLPSSSGR